MDFEDIDFRVVGCSFLIVEYGLVVRRGDYKL